MQEQLFYISELIGKELNGTITVNEATVLNEWMNRTKANKTLFDQLHDEAFIKQQLEKFDRYDLEKNRAYLMEKLAEEVASRESLVVSGEEVDSPSRPSVAGSEPVLRIGRRQLWKRIAVAASLIGVLFVGYWLLRPSTLLSPANDTSTALSTDVKAPDKNRAQIRLADGTTVYLDSAGNGSLASQGNVQVVKTADGRIEYSPSTTAQGKLQYNTLTNPRGSKVIDVTLSDGSRVWLNAGSSVTYPVAFAGSERKVSITGEAYFEVNGQQSTVDGKKIPFIVSKGAVSVTVLGTHFNVNAYDDESEIKVTLLEGSVKVSMVNTSTTTRDQRSTVIKPGQQARATADGGLTTMNGVDTEQVVAWKNGKFLFNSQDIKSILRQAARWYDLEVTYQGTITETFSGEVNRTVNAKELFSILEATGKVAIEINGNNVLVKAK